jgi:hypothetical protein
MFSKCAASLQGHQSNFHQACRDALSGFLPVQPCYVEGAQCHLGELRQVHEAKAASWHVSKTRMRDKPPAHPALRVGKSISRCACIVSGRFPRSAQMCASGDFLVLPWQLVLAKADDSTIALPAAAERYSNSCTDSRHILPAAPDVGWQS